MSRFLLSLALVAAAASGTFLYFRTSGPPSPNVVIITLDTTRADHLGCYGYGGDTSPNLDRLARRGALFQRAISSAAVTPVSHASLFTGQYPYRHGLRVLHGEEKTQLPPQARTLAEILEEHGYETGAAISAFPAGSHFGLAQGFSTFDEEFAGTGADPVRERGVVATSTHQRHAGDTTDRALEWLQPQGDAPFFLWVHYFDPHDQQLLPPQEFLDRFPAPTGSPRERLREVYDREIRYMDEQLGRLLDHLAKRHENTHIVVVADHGEGLGDHDWWTHGILYEEQIRVPLIVASPGGISRQVPHLVRTIDVMPTLLELTGVPVAAWPASDGTSLVPVLSGGAATPGLTAYADSINMLAYGFADVIREVKDEMLFSVQDERWKYIHHVRRPSESELYDLSRDPRELVNLKEANPEEVRRLIRDLRRRDPVYVPPPSEGRTPPHVLERLRSLGYTR